MSKTLFPEADAKFAKSVKEFASVVRMKAAELHLSAEEVGAIAEAEAAFDAAYRLHADRFNRSMKTRIVKDRARAECESVLRAAANRIRAHREISDGLKELLGIKLRPARLKKRRCPQRKPWLRFEGVDGGTTSRAGTHVIAFGDGNFDLSKPGRLAGAERLELFVDLVPLGEAIPTWPGERSGGRMWFVGAFTRSPLKVQYPKCDQPMVLVYWGRWASGNNDFGPFSPTLVTRIEGRDLMLSESPDALERQKQQTIIITSGHRQLPDLLNVNAIIEPQRALPAADAIKRSEAA